MTIRTARKITLGVAASIIALSTGIFTTGTAGASTYPPAQIYRVMFINPYDYTAGPAWLPYAGPRKIYLTAGTYSWDVEVYATWDMGIVLAASRSIYLNSNWYYWRCYVKTVLVDDLGDTGAQNYCSLTPTDGSTPTAYLTDTYDEGGGAWAVDGAGDYNWISELDWKSNP